MSYKKWSETDEISQNPQAFPWGTLGVIIIIAVSSVLIAGITFFVYQGKYETNLAKLTTERNEHRQALADLNKIRHDYSGIVTRVENLETKLSQHVVNQPSTSQALDEPIALPIPPVPQKDDLCPCCGHPVKDDSPSSDEKPPR